MPSKMPKLDYASLIEKSPGLQVGFSEISEILIEEDISAIERFVLKDPVMSSRVIAAANSAAVNRSNMEVLSVKHAIPKIGLSWVRNIILASLYTGQFEPDKCPLFDKKKYWNNCMQIGVMTESIANVLDHPCDKIRSGGMIAGLVSKIGLPFMAHYFPSEMHRALLYYINQDDEKPHAPLSKFIYEVTSIDYKHVGSMILEHWQVPEALSQVPMCTKRQPRISGDLRALVSFVRAWSKSDFAPDSPVVTALPAQDRQRILDRREDMLAHCEATITLINQ